MDFKIVFFFSIHSIPEKVEIVDLYFYYQIYFIFWFTTIKFYTWQTFRQFALFIEKSFQFCLKFLFVLLIFCLLIAFRTLQNFIENFCKVRHWFPSSYFLQNPFSLIFFNVPLWNKFKFSKFSWLYAVFSRWMFSISFPLTGRFWVLSCSSFHRSQI